MHNDPLVTSTEKGSLLVSYSNEKGDRIGYEFSSTTQGVATAIFGVCATTMGIPTRALVSSSFTGDTGKNSTDGGDDMEKRLAVLEVEVSHIRSDVSELKTSTISIQSTVNTIDKNMAVVLEKLSSIKADIDKKPSSDAVARKISDAKLAILLGVPAIIAIGTAIINYAPKLIN